MGQFSRTELLLGKKAIEKLQNSTVAVFGVGGVGSFAAEALARAGLGGFAIFDGDKVCLTNINRQLIATYKTIGREKVEVMKERILEINPKARVETFSCFYSHENAADFDLSGFSYVVDAIDTVPSKLVLIEKAKTAGVPIISSMGAGNKLDPTMFEVSDISKTSVCPLAKIIRKELKKRGINSLKVVYSKEIPLKLPENVGVGSENSCDCPPGAVKKRVPGSVSFVPPVAGLILAGEVIKDLINQN